MNTNSSRTARDTLIAHSRAAEGCEAREGERQNEAEWDSLAVECAKKKERHLLESLCAFGELSARSALPAGCPPPSGWGLEPPSPPNVVLENVQQS